MGFMIRRGNATALYRDGEIHNDGDLRVFITFGGKERRYFRWEWGSYKVDIVY
jgi:hypothetical protein